MKVYYSNDRIAGSEKILQRYTLSTKIIDGEINTRIDYQDTGSGPISVIVSPRETICFSPNTGNVISRKPSDQEMGKYGSGIAADYSLFGKLDIPEVKEKYRVLGYDILEDAANTKAFAISVPIGLIPRKGSANTPLSFKMYFDAAAETYVGTESVEGTADGALITTQCTNIYDDSTGVSVLVGTVTTIKNDKPGRLDVSDSMLTPLCEGEDVKEIDAATAAELVASGQAMTVAEPFLGDPSDPDYIETYVAAYEEVKVNTLDDAYFRVGIGR